MEVFTWISLGENWPLKGLEIILFANVYFASVFFCLLVSILALLFLFPWERAGHYCMYTQYCEYCTNINVILPVSYHFCSGQLHCTDSYPITALPPCILRHACDIVSLVMTEEYWWFCSCDTTRCKSSAHAHCVATSSAEVCLQHFNCLFMKINSCLIEIILYTTIVITTLGCCCGLFPPRYILRQLLCFEFENLLKTVFY